MAIGLGACVLDLHPSLGPSDVAALMGRVLRKKLNSGVIVSPRPPGVEEREPVSLLPRERLNVSAQRLGWNIPIREEDAIQ